jgi:hypothetical protein
VGRTEISDNTLYPQPRPILSHPGFDGTGRGGLNIYNIGLAGDTITFSIEVEQPIIVTLDQSIVDNIRYFGNIQAAINSLPSSGGIISLDRGTHTGPGNRNIIWPNKNLTIMALHFISFPPIIDFEGYQGFILTNAHSHNHLRNIRLRNSDHAIYLTNSNLTISDGHVGLSGRNTYIIANQGSHVNISNGTLEFMNYARGYFNNSSISVSGGLILSQPGSVISICSGNLSLLNSSTLTMRGNNSRLNVKNGFHHANHHTHGITVNSSVIRLEQAARLYIDEAFFTKSNQAILRLNGGARVTLTNHAKFTMQSMSRIWGHMSGDTIFIDNPILDFDSNFGDVIIFKDSTADFSVDSIISGGGINLRFGGLHFHSTGKPKKFNNVIRSNLSLIQHIVLNNVHLQLNQSTIHDIHSILAVNGSSLHLFNSIYEHNQDGILAIDSSVSINNSQIRNNANRSLFLKNSQGINSLTNNSLISHSGSHGVQLINSPFVSSNSTIKYSNSSGIHNVSLTPPALGSLNLINNARALNHNNFAEIMSVGTAFPFGGVTNISSSDNRLLLWALPELPPHLINVSGLPIAVTDRSRVYPPNAFCFGVPQNCGGTLPLTDNHVWHKAMCITYRKSSLECPYLIIGDIKSLIRDFPESAPAGMLIGFLPYLWQEIDMCDSTLIYFLYDMTHPNLLELAQFYLATHYLLSHYYEDSMYMFDGLSRIAVSPLVILFSEMGQARSYYMLVKLGLRTDHDVTHRPRTSDELAYIISGIMERLCLLNSLEQEIKGEQYYGEIPEIFETALLGNFPNPFNPNTTINFTVGTGLDSAQVSTIVSYAGHAPLEQPHSSVHVTLEIFNIRGQRVRTLVSGVKEPGHHSIVWDSTDGRGQSVSSGIYFYRLTAGDFVETRRMLLLK